MFGKGPILVLAGFGCIALPGANMLYEIYAAEKETKPDIRMSKYQAEEACVKDSVRIGGVWVGCKATSVGRESKDAPRKLQMNSQINKGPSGRSHFIRID